jgi:TonB family protein
VSSSALLALAIVRWRAGDSKTAAEIVNLVLALPRVDMATHSAADLLRSRLPGALGSTDPTTEPAAKLTPEMLASRAAVSLQHGNERTAAGALLDRLLAERGTTAPKLKLDPVVVTSAKNEAPRKNRWAAIEEKRVRAAAKDPDAMFEIAIAHALGDGAEFSPALATAWFLEAGKNGHRVAGLQLDASDPDGICEYLQKQRIASPGEIRPPLDGELKARIAEARSSAPRSGLVVAHHILPRYPEEKRRAGLDGNVLVDFQVDGHPQAVNVAQASDPVFAAAAEECVRQWRFIPVIRDQKAVATEVELTLRFQTTADAPAEKRP